MKLRALRIPAVSYRLHKIQPVYVAILSVTNKVNTGLVYVPQRLSNYYL